MKRKQAAQFYVLYKKPLADGQIFNPAIHCQHIPRRVLSNKDRPTPKKVMQTAFRIYKLQSNPLPQSVLNALHSIFGEEEKQALAYLISLANKFMLYKDFTYSQLTTDIQEALNNAGIYNYHTEHHSWRPSKKAYAHTTFLGLSDLIQKLAQTSAVTNKSFLDYGAVCIIPRMHYDIFNISDSEVVDGMYRALSKLTYAYRCFGYYMTLVHITTFSSRYPQIRALLPRIHQVKVSMENGVIVYPEIFELILDLRDQIPEETRYNINRNTADTPLKATSFFS